jgi:hypothetical protein
VVTYTGARVFRASSVQRLSSNAVIIKDNQTSDRKCCSILHLRSAKTPWCPPGQKCIPFCKTQTPKNQAPLCPSSWLALRPIAAQIAVCYSPAIAAFSDGMKAMHVARSNENPQSAPQLLHKFPPHSTHSHCSPGSPWVIASLDIPTEPP